LQIELKNEQKDVIKVKKSLKSIQTKFSQRHKFTGGESGVYILQNPDDKYEKFKIGLTTDINERLTTDRTMIPNLKVRLIMYTPHHEMFEKAIKYKYAEQLELPSHEWVFENLEKLIEGFREIDKAFGFNSRLETDLWRYNLEDPTPEHLILDSNMPKEYNKLSDKLAGILPTSLIRCDYIIKNKNAPEGHRYCNAFCQTYKPTSDFVLRSSSHLTICNRCDLMADVAQIKILNGVLTEDEIRRDPSLLMLNDRERICRKCIKIKDINDFPEKKRQCKTCRNANRSKHGEKFDQIIQDEIAILKNLSDDTRSLKLDTYVKTELHKIAQYLELGRKYNDNKQSMINKIKKYYSEIQI